MTVSKVFSKSKFTKVTGKHPLCVVCVCRPQWFSTEQGRDSLGLRQSNPNLPSLSFVLWSLGEYHRHSAGGSCYFLCSLVTSYSCDCHRSNYKCFSDVDPVLLLDNTGPTNRGGSLSPLGDLKSVVSIYYGIFCLPLWILGKSCSHTTQWKNLSEKKCMSWRLALRSFTKKCRQGLMAVMKNQDQSASLGGNKWFFPPSL